MTRFCSIFSQLLQLFPRADFQQAVVATKAERHARGFTCWGQFVAMVFCQLGRAHSLREICQGLASCEGKLTHLGIVAPKRSTLAYANAHRPWELYQTVFYQLLERCRTVTGGRTKFRFKNKLLSLDTTVIDLCADVFDWAHFRRHKGAVKLHFTLDHDGYLPLVLVITEGKRHDLTVARQQTFAAGTVLVFDRGYIDYAWLAHLQRTGVTFVTRCRANTDYHVTAAQAVPTRGGVLTDERIALDGPKVSKKYPADLPLRRIRVQIGDRDEPLVFLTNHAHWGPTTIARIYKDRWQIELFFKALKQNLRVKTFVGTSRNALHIQIWTALITLLLLKYLQLTATFGWSLSNLLALLRMNLFVYRDLFPWLNDPFTAPPPLPEPVQGTLALT